MIRSDTKCGRDAEISIVDLCSLCNCYQFSSDCVKNHPGYSQHDSEVGDVLKVFLADNGKLG